jgi:Uma2 family endonuclease
MTEAAPRRWTSAEFFAWQETQPERYELVDGFPVRMMAGARNVHDDIVVNILAELRNQLRGSACRPFTGDGSIETKPGQIRRPDIGVDCGPRDPNATKAASPRILAEVLSPTTRDFDTIGGAIAQLRNASTDSGANIGRDAIAITPFSKTLPSLPCRQPRANARPWDGRKSSAPRLLLLIRIRDIMEHLLISLCCSHNPA